VSAALNRLRHVFNDNLFVRQGNEMLPTPLAAELADRARLALAEIEAMVGSVRGLELADLSRTFTLMGADFFSMLLMPHLAAKVRAQAPNAKLRLLDSARGDVARLLQENAVDVALERPLDMPEWVSSELLFHSPFVIIAAASNPTLANVGDHAAIPLETYLSLPHVIRSIDGSMSGMLDEALAEAGQARNVTLALPHFQGVALAVAGSDGIAAVPIQFARAVGPQLGLRLFAPPIDVPVPGVNIYWHSRYDKDAAHQWLRSQIIASVSELGFD
jgi:DNA-binding transcriptional LysR family regulator